MKRKQILLLLALFFLLFVAPQSFAAEPGGWIGSGDYPSIDDIGGIVNGSTPGGADAVSWKTIISTSMEVLLLFGIIVGLLYLVWGGFDWITSSGDKQKVSKARTKIIMAILGLIIIFSSFFFVNVIVTFFKLR